MSQPIRCQGGHLVFPMDPKNTNLVKDAEILLPVKIHWIPFSAFRGEVRKCISQSEVRAVILFSARPEIHKLGRGRWDLASCQVSMNTVHRFQRRSWKCPSKSEVMAALLFSDRPEKLKLGRERWDLASCQVSLNSVQLLLIHRRSRKCLDLASYLKFRWIPFSAFRGEVENALTNQRP